MSIATFDSAEALSRLEPLVLPRIPRRGARSSLTLASSDVLQMPPTFKCYQGLIGVGRWWQHETETEWFLYVGYTLYGPRHSSQAQEGRALWTGDLGEAVQHVNKILKSKLRKGYQGAGVSDLVSLESAQGQIKALLS